MNPEPDSPQTPHATTSEAAASQPATTPEASPRADASPAAPAAPQLSASADAASAEGGGTEGGASAEGAEGAPGGPPGEAGHKKRRRRRKKRGAGGAVGEGAAAADGGGEDGADGGSEEATDGDGTAANKPGDKPGDRPAKNKKPRPPREPRERPAFNVGDVVFGKILEVSDDVIFVDLSGKGRGIFDKLELLLPEDVADEVEAQVRQAEAEAEALFSGRGAGHAAGDSGEAAGTATQGQEPSAGDAAAEPSTAPVPSEAPDTEVQHTAPDAASEGSEAQGEPEVVDAARAAGDTADAGQAEGSSDGTAGTTGEGTSDEGTSSDETEAAKPGVIQLPRVVLEPGAPFVGVVHNDGGRGGLVVLTHHPKRGALAKPAVVAAFKNKTTVDGIVTGLIKGGVEVDVHGLRAFAPGSHMELRLGADLGKLVGKRLPFEVTHYAKRGRDVVLSRRSMLEAEWKAAREAALARVKPGEVVEGIVRSVVQFGAFVDIGGVEGLVPLTEMSHNRSDGPRDVFKVGETIAIKILRVDEKGKVWLSRKAAVADPWVAVRDKYAVGTRHTAKVVRLQPFGAFVELESGVDGLIHAADLSLKRIEHPSEVVKVGDELEVVVSSVDPGTHKIALHPAPAGEAANEEPQRVQINKNVKVVVVAVESGGLVVRITGATGRHARGYISAMATGTPRGTELRKPFPPGKELEAKVIELDPRRGEVKLSIKALQQDSERNAYQQYRQQVKREAKFGTFADLLAKKK